MDHPLLVSKIHPEAVIPSRGSSGAVGYDLYSVSDAVILPQERLMIPTGITLKIPPGYYGRIAPRSGYSYKHGIDVLAGVIDPDYQGEISVILLNTSKDIPFDVSKGQRIAQLVLEKCSVPPVIVVDDGVMDKIHKDNDFREYTFKMENTNEGVAHKKRGKGGFGSTGTH